MAAIIIMATVPLGLVCAVFACCCTGMSLNIYSQIGLVMLVGIMAKNGILIVEFANQLRDRGREAAASHPGCLGTIRLRPVMMTMIATILGGVPLIIAGWQRHRRSDVQCDAGFDASLREACARSAPGRAGHPGTTYSRSPCSTASLISRSTIST